MEEKQVEKKGLSVASMVLGIISVVLFCFIYVSIPCSILAIIFGIIGKKQGGKGMAVAGIVLGIISAALCLLAIAGIASMFAGLPFLTRYY